MKAKFILCCLSISIVFNYNFMKHSFDYSEEKNFCYQNSSEETKDITLNYEDGTYLNNTFYITYTTLNLDVTDIITAELNDVLLDNNDGVYNITINNNSMNILNFYSNSSLIKQFYLFNYKGYTTLSSYSSDNAYYNAYDFLLNENIINENEYKDLMYEVKKVDMPLTSNYSTLNSLSNIFSGLIKWKADSNLYSDLVNTKVYLVWHKIGDLFSTTYETTTDENGYFIFNIDRSLINYNRDISLIIKAENAYAAVSYNQSSTPYEIILDIKDKLRNNILYNFNLHMVNDSAKALQISQALIVAGKYYEYLTGNKLPQVKACYPADGSRYFTSIFGKIIDIERDNVTDPRQSYHLWDIIMHEYGHYVSDMCGLDQSPGGTHYLTKNHSEFLLPSDREPSYNEYLHAKTNGLKLSWGEGFATYFSFNAGYMFKHLFPNVLTIGDSIYTHKNTIIDLYDSNFPNNMKGEACEFMITYILFDIGPYGTSTTKLSHTEIFNAIKSVKPVTFNSLYNKLLVLYPQIKESLNNICSITRISPYNIEVQKSSSYYRVTWMRGGTSTVNFTNDTFYIYFYDNNNVVTSAITTNNSYVLGGSYYITLSNSTNPKVVIIGESKNYYDAGQYSSITVNM